MSFEDLQHKALELLSHDEYELSGDFDAVFVDEYQDVNPTQEAIIRKLVKGECFMVGDVKQSIYGFRLADPAIFISRQNAYEESVKEGTNVYFNRNFRSAYGILDFVNGVFDSAMTKASADVDYKKDARFELKDVAPVKLEGVSPEGYVQVHLFVKQKSESVPSFGLYDIEKTREKRTTRQVRKKATSSQAKSKSSSEEQRETESISVTAISRCCSAHARRVRKKS